MTKLIKQNQVNDKILKQAGHIIREGGLVAFPTETVYGLGADGLNEEAIDKIFVAKNRPQDNPVILHVGSVEMAQALTTDDLRPYQDLIEAFWPGPLSLIVNKSDEVPYQATGGLDTVAIRFPRNDIAIQLIQAANRPLAGPSANISGRPSPTDAQTVMEDLAGRIDMVLDGGPTTIGIESTVLDISTPQPQILRPGAITQEDIMAFIPDVTLDASLEDISQRPKSPGQKYKHYAPSKPTALFVGDQDAKLANIKDYLDPKKTYGYMISSELRVRLDLDETAIVYVYGSIEDHKSIAEKIFKTLRLLDKEDIDEIIVEGLDYTGQGLAIMNRLEKSAGGNIIGQKI